MSLKTISNNIEVSVITQQEVMASVDIRESICNYEKEIDKMSVDADKLDYAVAIASGIICGIIDIIKIGELDLKAGRNIADEKVKDIVRKISKRLGCEKDDIQSCVKFLEEKFPLAADGNTADFGGGLQHHLRDFAHHPTIVGLCFSLLTQFTEMSYGTDSTGRFIIVPVSEKSRRYIGDNIADKIFMGTVGWFFHLVSDIAGSSATAALSGGTGIPGPIIALAKEAAVMPIFRDINVEDNSLSEFLAKIYNGTLFARYDNNGKIIKDSIIKIDFRGEIGALLELGKQAIPIILNECIVRGFYFIRRILSEVKDKNVTSMSEIKKINWDTIKPYNNVTLTRLLTISTSVFCAIDLTDAVVTEQYFVSVNYVGLGRLTLALGAEYVNLLKTRNLKKIRDMYKIIEQNVYAKMDEKIYERIYADMKSEKFGLTLQQTEILYNIEYLKVLNDIEQTKGLIGGEKVAALKREWLQEWKNYMTIGFPKFMNNENVSLNWYDKGEIIAIVESNNPSDTWFRLVLLEAMLFEPYYALSTVKNDKGEEVPSKKYRELQVPIKKYSESKGDDFLDELFDGEYYQKGYIKRLRKTYKKVISELNEVMKNIIKGIAIAAGVTIVAVVTAGAFAPSIAVGLVGSNFAGLNGAALTSACLAYLGGGAVACGGLGMAGGTMAIVGGGAMLGIGAGAGVGTLVGASGIIGKKSTIIQSAMLIVSVREIFLNDEHDIEYSNTIYEQYVKNVSELEKALVDLKIKEENIDDKEEKKKLKTEIKDTEETVEAMKIAMRSMKKYNTAFATGESAKKSKYPVITLCGSTRFKKEFIEAQKRLTLEGNIVLSVGLFGHSGDEEVWEDMDEGTITKTKIMLDDMHKRKIDMSDEIYVINVGGYIGDSTKSEIEYAKKNGKRVRYLETDED